MAVGPAGVHYQNSAPTLSGYGNNCLMVVNAKASRTQAARILELRTAGTEVLEYVLPIHDYPGSHNDVNEWVSFYTGGTGGNYSRANIPSSWFWDPSNPSRVTVGAYSGYVMDMRANSAWSDHMLDWFEDRMADPNWKMDGWFLDVFGDGYLGAISGLSSPEQVAYKAGIVSFANRLRNRLGDEVILIGNNTWETNVPLNGLCIENHSTPGPFYDAQFLRPQPPLGRRRNMTISGSVPLTQTWAAQSGNDHACLHGNDGYMVAQSPPFGTVTAGAWPVEKGHIVMWDSTQSGGEDPDPPDPVAPGAITLLAISEPIAGQIRITFTMPTGVTGYVSRFKYGLGQTFSGPTDGNEFRSTIAHDLENVLTSASDFNPNTAVTVGVWARNGDLFGPVTTIDITTAPLASFGKRTQTQRVVDPSRRVARV